MSAWELYFLTRLDTIHNVLDGIIILGITFGIVGVMVTVGCLMTEEEKIGNMLRRLLIRLILPILLIGCSGAIFLPTCKDYLIIRGVSTVTQNERVINNTAKIINSVEAYIDKTLKESK